MTTEVTQGQWQSVMGLNPSTNDTCGADCPVESVSWEDIQQFIVQLNGLGEGTYRLPTEAEWEYAARANTTTATANGDLTVIDCSMDPNLDPMAWYCYNSGPDLASMSIQPVARKLPNYFALYDMHGNVWEWVQDYYQDDLGTSSQTDPTGPVIGTERVFRSGAYNFAARYSRSASRLGADPSVAAYDRGLRLVVE